MSTQINPDDSSATLTTLITADWDDDSERTPMCAVVSAVAEAEGVDVVDLPPLYNSIDPEALNRVFSSGAVESVEFEYAGYTVVVRGGGEVVVQSA